MIVVGTGLAGASAAASLAELGYQVDAFTFHDSPRRAHSIAAQGGINAAKNYQNDGDSVWRLFYDTIKGGDFRSREANVYRLAQVSSSIIDQCVSQGVPFAREYGGQLANRSFGGAQVSQNVLLPWSDGPAIAVGCLLGFESASCAGDRFSMHTRKEMLDLVTLKVALRGIITRDLVSGVIAVMGCRCGRARYRWLLQCLLPVDQRQGLQRHGNLSGVQTRSGLCQPVFHPDSSHLHPGQRRTPVEVDADVRVAAQ